MEKRKVTVLIGGQLCSFYSDDSDEYLLALEQRANAVMRQTAMFSGSSAYTNAILSVLSQTDALMRLEQRKAAAEKPASPAPRKAPAKEESPENRKQISVWDLLSEKD
ncbi:MAG: hypothetical protein J6U01_06105 [Clostridia bacterium]|nr:hypothetical protein [Clostridia bacterium]